MLCNVHIFYYPRCGFRRQTVREVEYLAQYHHVFRFYILLIFSAVIFYPNHNYLTTQLHELQKQTARCIWYIYYYTASVSTRIARLNVHVFKGRRNEAILCLLRVIRVVTVMSLLWDVDPCLFPHDHLVALRTHLLLRTCAVTLMHTNYSWY